VGGVFLTALLAVTLFIIVSPLYSQDRESDPGVSGRRAGDQAEIAETVKTVPQNESAIILGEVPPSVSDSAGAPVLVVFRMVLVLALAALAIYGVVFFIKRLARTPENKDPHLKVLARVPLGNDSFAAVLSVGDKAWLVGGGSGGVNLISEITEIEALETMLLDDARRAAEPGNGRFIIDFRSLLRRLGGGSRSGENDNPGSSHAEALRKQRERLKGL
jgi:flagellar protein FliO/FliZ